MDDTLRHIQERLDELGRRYDDRAIGKAWTELATDKPTERISVNGLLLVVRRKVVGFNKVEYRAFLGSKAEPVAWMYCQALVYGRVQVTNANVYEVDGIDYRRHGIGTAIYDLIERDVRQSGGWGVEPHWGSMSAEAIAFWKKRRPDQADKIETLNRFGPGLATGLFD